MKKLVTKKSDVDETFINMEYIDDGDKAVCEQLCTMERKIIMNIGVKIENMHDLQDEVVLKKLKEIKVKHLEIQIKDCNKESMFFTQEFSQYILEIMNRNGFTISFHGTLGINYIEKIDRLRETAFDILKDMLILCDKVNATWLTLHIGECGSGRRNIETRLNRFIEEINNLYLSEKLKTIIAVENMPTKDIPIILEYRKLEMNKVEKSSLYLDKIQDNIKF